MNAFDDQDHDEHLEEARPRPLSIILGHDQDVIPLILNMHARPNPVILDATFNTGKMWKGLDYAVTGIDIDPKMPCQHGDFTAIPFGPETFDVVAFDPPHLPNANATNARTSGHADVYGVRVQSEDRSGDNVEGTFAPFLSEAKRVLRHNGIVIVKMADLVHNHAYQWQHVDFINAARAAGMTPCDLVVLCNPTAGNLLSSKWKNVKHFRRGHCFWIVVRKGRCEAPR